MEHKSFHAGILLAGCQGYKRILCLPLTDWSDSGYSKRSPNLAENVAPQTFPACRLDPGSSPHFRYLPCDRVVLAFSQEGSMSAPGSRFRFGSFELDGSSNELRKNGLRIRLEDQPFRILWMLVSRQGNLVTREELKEALWTGDTHVDFDRSLNRAVNKVRLAIGDSASNPRFIETLSRRGYRFVAPASVIDETRENSQGTPESSALIPGTGPRTDYRLLFAAHELPAGPTAESRIQPGFWRFWRSRFVAGLIVVVSITGALAFARWRRQRDQQAELE